MYKNDEVETCFEYIRERGWTWFVTLKYPLVGSAKHKGPCAKNAEDAFSWWFSAMSSPNCRDSFDEYVRVTEHRENGDTLIHVLLRATAGGRLPKDWRWLWFDGSAGAAWERPVDDKIEGLFKYFFYKVHCDMECSILGDVTSLRADDYAPRK